MTSTPTTPPDPQTSLTDAVVDALIDMVARLEPTLARQQIGAAVAAAAASRHKRRTLATAVLADPGLLDSGRPDGPLAVGQLIAALRERGARAVVAPGCAECGRVTLLTGLRADGLRICPTCSNAARAARLPCSRCGRAARVYRRGRDDAVICRVCWQRPEGDPVELICAFLSSAAPRADPTVIVDCVAQVGTEGGANAMFRLLWELQDQPGLLAGTTAPRSARAARLITALVAAGVPGIMSATCPECHTVAPLTDRLHGRRCCLACYRLAHLQDCTRCGRRRVVASRSPDGAPLCSPCHRPSRLIECVLCRQIRPAGRTSIDGPVCTSCYQPDAPTSVCATPRRAPRGRCRGCVRNLRVRRALSINGALRPELEPLRRILTSANAVSTLKWLRTDSAVAVLTALATGQCALTHAGLDGLRPNGSVGHLRAALITAGTLPARDDHLATLEQWITTTLGAVDDEHERQLLRRYATWHHLRRLRRSAATHPVTPTQTGAARASVRAAAALLAWLRSNRSTLAQCRQADLDGWVADGATSRLDARGFVQWCTRNHYTGSALSVPPREKLSHVRPLDPDERWHIARRLLHDDTVTVHDRVAGLLVLLFAQPVTTIVGLPLSSVTLDAEAVHLALGDATLRLPEPLAGLTRQLSRRRRGHNTLGADEDSPWLFPGGRAGQHLSHTRMSARLKPLGIYSRSARAAALLDLSTQLPAAVLTRLLGISIGTATAWTAAGGQWARYAATLPDRPHPRARPSSTATSSGLRPVSQG